MSIILFRLVGVFLFFLWFGLSAFVPALNTDMFKKVGTVLAILIAVLPFLVMV